MAGPAADERGVFLTGSGGSVRPFDRFVTDRVGNGGSGLGLTVVERLVASDRGTIDLRQTAGGGLTVAISRPVTDPAPGEQRPPAPTKSTAAS